jgi:hypothetical protein
MIYKLMVAVLISGLLWGCTTPIKKPARPNQSAKVATLAVKNLEPPVKTHPASPASKGGVTPSAAAPIKSIKVPDTAPIKTTTNLAPPMPFMPPTLVIRGPLKEACLLVAKRWGKLLDWAIDESSGMYVLSYEVLMSGKTLEEDLQNLGDAVSNETLRVKFDVYPNNIVKISKAGDE